MLLPFDKPWPDDAVLCTVNRFACLSCGGLFRLPADGRLPLIRCPYCLPDLVYYSARAVAPGCVRCDHTGFVWVLPCLTCGAIIGYLFSEV